MDDQPSRLSARDCHRQRVLDQPGPHVRRHRPADNRRLQASRTTARYSQPAQVGTYVMSATHSWSGPPAEKSRSTKSGAGRALARPCASWLSCKRLRVTPSMPSFLIRRATLPAHPLAAVDLAAVAPDHHDPVLEPRTRAREPGLRPALTSSTIRSLYSGGYCATPLPAMAHLQWLTPIGRCPSKRGNSSPSAGTGVASRCARRAAKS